MAPKSLGSTVISNNKVKLETMTRIKSIPWAKRSNDFAVMVRVTAPLLCDDENSRTPVDLVAVLDISGSMAGDRLKSMKQAMMFAIDNLGPDDRLSIVAFDHEVERVTELSVMSDANRNIARAKVDKLKEKGGTNMGKGMQEAAAILRERGPEEKNIRAGRIVFLSDGDDNSVLKQEMSSEFPADAFGLDADHNPKVLRYIADKTLGTYSYVNEDTEKIKCAFAQSLSGLTSITAMDLQIQLKAHDGVTILAIESGAYKKTIGPDKKSGTIHVQDMYAGEEKNFIVFLTIPERTTKLIMTVSGCYRSPNKASIPLGESEVEVARPWLSILSDETVNPRVAAELVRLKLVKGISAIGDQKQPSGNTLQRLWDDIRDSEDGRKAPVQTLANLGKEVAGMNKAGMAFMLSWLTSHLWQRATTKDSPSQSRAFQIPAMKELVRQADDNPEPELEPEPEPEPIPTLDNNVVKIMYGKAITWAAGHRYSCKLACLVALVLLAGAFVLP